jgi:hypothetical protein
MTFELEPVVLGQHFCNHHRLRQLIGEELLLEWPEERRLDLLFHVLDSPLCRNDLHARETGMQDSETKEVLCVAMRDVDNRKFELLGLEAIRSN